MHRLRFISVTPADSDADVKSLLILRHAKSDWSRPGLSDHDRPLNSRGERDASRMGRLILEEDLLPDLILTSTALRARSTATVVAEVLSFQGEVRELQQLYLACPDALRSAVGILPDSVSRVLLVGHNPGLEEWTSALAGEAVRLPTAALARIDLPLDRWRELADTTRGQLIHVWRPKELR